MELTKQQIQLLNAICNYNHLSDRDIEALKDLLTKLNHYAKNYIKQ